MFRLGGLGIIAAVFFFVWSMMPSDPYARLDRVCKPIEWTNSFMTSMTLLVWPKGGQSVDTFFKELDYGCEYAIWRLAYEKEYIEELKAKGQLDANGNPIPQDEDYQNPQEYNDAPDQGDGTVAPTWR